MSVRKEYLKQIEPLIDINTIKVLTGIRRCGKSTVLSQLIEHLLILGVKREFILHINFELLKYVSIDTAEKLIDYIDKMSVKPKYILLDEIQNVDRWEIVVNGLLASNDFDIYITGSNSKLLSSELSTILSGRFVEFHIDTLVFSEFIKFYPKINDIETLFNKFLCLGGFPFISSEKLGQDVAELIIGDIYSSIVLKDTVQRHNVRDVDLLNRIVRFTIDNLGNTFSAKSISDYFKSENRKVDIETIYSYLSFLEEAFIITRIPRYDIRGKELLKTYEKYYLGDHSFIGAVFGNSENKIAGILENIVWKELLFRGHNVAIGKFGDKEIDFVATKKEEVVYIQVSYLMSEESTWEREIGSLKDIKSNYEKIILTLDKARVGNYDGIKCVYLPEWLLGEK